MRILLVPLTIWLGFVSAVWAETEATEDDVGRLQDDLRNLEAELESVDDQKETPLAPEYLDRVQDIRNNVIYLRVKMKRHQEEGETGTGIDLAEIREVQNDIAALRADLGRLRSNIPEGSVTLPVGTEVKARLQESLSTSTSRQGDAFSATTLEPVVRTGHIVVPAGATFHGVVEVVDPPEGRTDRKARMVLAIDRIEVDEDSHPVSATVTDASEQLETGIGDEKAKIGVGAGIGSILGAVLGGKKGAVVGAVLGGTGAILATEGKDVELPRGTVLTLHLDRELTVPVPPKSTALKR